MNHGGSNAELIGSSQQLRQREQAVQASLSVAHSHIQQGDTTGALQVACCWLPDNTHARWKFVLNVCCFQVVFELLREVCGEAAVLSAADRYLHTQHVLP